MKGQDVRSRISAFASFGAVFAAVNGFAPPLQTDHIFLVGETFLGDVLVEPEQAEEVGDGHEAVHGVGEVPYEVEGGGGTDEGDDASTKIGRASCRERV